MSQVENRLAELGHTLPQVATPAGSYLPAMISGNLVFTAGQIPLIDGKLMATGKLGAEIDAEQGAQIAERCALNALAAIKSVLGDLTESSRLSKLLASWLQFLSSQPSQVSSMAPLSFCSRSLVMPASTLEVLLEFRYCRWMLQSRLN